MTFSERHSVADVSSRPFSLSLLSTTQVLLTSIWLNWRQCTPYDTHTQNTTHIIYLSINFFQYFIQVYLPFFGCSQWNLHKTNTEHFRDCLITNALLGWIWDRVNLKDWCEDMCNLSELSESDWNIIFLTSSIISILHFLSPCSNLRYCEGFVSCHLFVNFCLIVSTIL